MRLGMQANFVVDAGGTRVHRHEIRIVQWSKLSRVGPDGGKESLNVRTRVPD